MAKVRHIPQGDPVPEWFLDALQEHLATIASANFRVTRLNDTTVRIVAGAGADQVSVALANAAGNVAAWRRITATITAAHPGGAAGDYNVWVTANASVYGANPTPPPDELDSTNYAFALKISNTTPSGTGSEAVYRLVAVVTWDGTKITAIRQLIGSSDPNELAGGILRYGTFAARPAPTAANRYWYYAATDTKRGYQNQDGASWTLLWDMTVDAAVGTGSLRTLGPGSAQAAPGDDARFPTAAEKSALAGTAGTPGAGNRYVTDQDARLGKLPSGLVLWDAASAPPTGFVACDGAAISRTTFAALFARIGTVHGAGDGSTTFNVPDIRGRVVVGKGTHTTVDTLGETDAISLANRTVRHRHTVVDPGHTHTYQNPIYQGVAQSGSTQMSPNSSSGPTGSSTTGITVGASVTDNLDSPCYIVLNPIIST